MEKGLITMEDVEMAAADEGISSYANLRLIACFMNYDPSVNNLRSILFCRRISRDEETFKQVPHEEERQA